MRTMGMVLAFCLYASTLCAQVVINEFLAANKKAWTNEMGQTHDWIELYNTSSSNVDLTGWHLTDEAGDAKWRFPSGMIPASGYLLVYASQLDGLINGELHANFTLAPGGEYLGLIKPDGITVVSEFAPSYPSQTDDVSYGLRPDTRAVQYVDANASFVWCVPASSVYDAVWMQRTFVPDAAWKPSSKPGAIGYEPASSTNFTGLIGTQIPQREEGVYVRYSFVAGEIAESLTLKILYDDGFVVYLNGTKVLSVNAPANPVYNSTLPDSGNRQDADAKAWWEFDLSSSASLLRLNATNVLAIHAMIAQQRSPDLLLQAQLGGDVFVPGASGERRYFSTPTPLRRNVLGQADYLREVEFTPKRGYYTQPVQLRLTAPNPIATIRYTLNGTQPTLSNGMTYSAPILIQSNSFVRARAYLEGYEPSRERTHSYLFLNAFQNFQGVPATEICNSIRTVSLVMNPADFTALYGNPWLRGPAYEKAASMEWIDPEGGGNAQVNCGMRVYGNATRSNAKKTYRFLFKAQYGDGKLEYDVFKGYRKAATSFDTLIFKGDGVFDKLTNLGLIDQFIRHTFLDMHGFGSRSTFVHFFINGAYWGVYCPTERYDQAWGATYYGGLKEQWDCLNSDDPTGDSDVTTFNLLMTALGMPSISGYSSGEMVSSWPAPPPLSTETYFRIQGKNVDGTRNLNFPVLLDVDNHIDYHMAQTFGTTGDWPMHNWYAGCPSRVTDPDVRMGWKWFCWDTEASLQSPNGNNIGSGGPHNVHAALRSNPEYLLRFADRARKHLLDNGVLTPQKNIERFEFLAKLVEKGVISNASRWGNAGTYGTWQNLCFGKVGGYFPTRTGIYLQQLRDAGLYPLIDAPVFNQMGGLVTNQFQLIITAANPVYYTTDGRDPRQAVSGNVAGTLYNGTIPISHTMKVKARARNASGTWSALTEAEFVSPGMADWLRISEVMYHPYAPAVPGTNTSADFEFIEVANTGSAALSLNTVRIVDGVNFTFPEMTLRGGERAIVVANRAAFATRYNTNGMRIAGEYVGRLDDNGEQIRLVVSEQDYEVTSLTYSSGRGWPLSTDGAGHSLVPLDERGGQPGALRYGGNWRASARRGGSPCAPDPAPVRDVVLNELVAHTDLPTGTWTNPATGDVYDSNDWMELFNAGEKTVVLTNWFLSDDAVELKKWGIPGTNALAAGRFAHFDEIHDFHNPTNRGFGLSKDGERLFLSYLPGTAEDRVADCVRFDGQANGASQARYPDGGEHWRVNASPSPRAANSAAAPRVVISELMYHPSPTLASPEDNTSDEYVELYNPGPDIQLQSEAGPWRLSGEASYVFSNVTLKARQTVLLVPFNPAALSQQQGDFLYKYGLTNGEVRMVGPYSGKLSNRGGRLVLEWPQFPDVVGDPVSWVTVDDLEYFDQAPWPAGADGTGHSLQRISNTGCGNDAHNWLSDVGATPGYPPLKVTLSQPQNGQSFFLPLDVDVVAAVNPEQIVGTVRRVEFLLNDTLQHTATSAPYTWRLDHEVTVPGTYELRARVVDDSGSLPSPRVNIDAMRIRNVGAFEPTDASVKVGGEIQGNGSALVTIYWGQVDGGTNKNAWESSTAVGTMPPGQFLARVDQLSPNRLYYFRCHGQNATGDEGWSAEATAFRTLTYRDWTHRMMVRFPGYKKSGVLTNFPALVALSEAIPGFRYRDFSYSNASDLRFADPRDFRWLNFEVEVWNTNGTSYVWVQVPELAGTNTAIYALWGNANASQTPASQFNGSTWESRFQGVWHFRDNQVKDATVNDTDATSFGSTQSSGGVVGTCRSFSGQTGNHVYLGFHNRWLGRNIRNLTISFWVKPVASEGSVFGVDDPATTNRFYISVGRNGWTYVVKDRLKSQGTPTPSGRWQMLALVFDNNQAYGYWDNKARVSVGSYEDFEPAVSFLLGDKNNVSYPFQCSVDELQVSSVARSADWLWASYQTVASNAQFSSYAMVAVQADLPLVDNGPGATNVLSRAAYLNGTLQFAGGTGTLIRVYWGAQDGGTNATNWANVKVLGFLPEGTFAVRLDGLTPGSQYYYRARAARGALVAWASETARFQTLGEGPDQDRDGMADEWEKRFLGGTNQMQNGRATDDADGDLLSNLGEYVAGTDPSNSTRYFDVNLGLSNQLLKVWFDTVAATGENYQGVGRWYSLEKKTDLSPTSLWSGVGGFSELPGNGARVEYTNRIDGSRPLFFRGRVWLRPAP